MGLYPYRQQSKNEDVMGEGERWLQIQNKQYPGIMTSWLVKMTRFLCFWVIL